MFGRSAICTVTSGMETIRRKTKVDYGMEAITVVMVTDDITVLIP